jgi:hypothetical protein
MSKVGVATLTLFLVTCLTPPVVADDHPFALVNVVSLFEAFNEDEDIPFQSGWAGAPNTPPPNWNAYVARPRLGTAPAVVATDGERVWIGGEYESADWDGPPAEQEQSWYAAVGIGEIRGINDASGTGLDITYIPSMSVVGPGVFFGDAFRGMDYDEATETLWVVFNDQVDFNPGNLPNEAVQVDTYLRGVDVSSSGFGNIIYEVFNPQSGFVTEQAQAGVAVDPFTDSLAYAWWGSGFIRMFDRTDDSQPPKDFRIFDAAQSGCSVTTYRQMDFDPQTGDFFFRNQNAVQYVPRDLRGGNADPNKPFQTFKRFIQDGGDGQAETLPMGDDVLIGIASIPSAVPAGSAFIGVGPNGILDTVGTDLVGDDEFDGATLVTSLPIANNGQCGGDPQGFPQGTAPGQTLAVVPGGNLPGLDDTLVLANNRPTFGSNQVSELVFANTNGDFVATLELPCTPIATNTSGVAYFAADYHAPSGTLVVVEYERRQMYVFRAQVDGGPPVPRYDFSRNGSTDLFDLYRFQQCFTGPEFGGILSLNCQRLNTDSDCDIDLDDWNIVADYVDTKGGPIPAPPEPPVVQSPLAVGDTSVSLGGVPGSVTQVKVFADGFEIGAVSNPTPSGGVVNVPVAPALSKFESITAVQSNLIGTSGLADALEVGDGNGAVLVSLGIRESGDTGPIGSNGVSTGDFEWIGATTNGSAGAPQGFVLNPSAGWQTVTFDPLSDPISPFFELGDGQITETRGILESLAVAVNAASPSRSAGSYTLYVDNVVNVGAGPGATDVVLADFEGFALGVEVLFQEPTFSGSTVGNLGAQPDTSEVTNAQANGGTQSGELAWYYRDTAESRWVRVTTFGAANTALPIIDLTKPVRMDLLLQAP